LDRLSPTRTYTTCRSDVGNEPQEVFKREYGRTMQTKDGQIIFNYENHYSPRLNKCFFLEIAVSYEVQNGKRESTRVLRLIDLNDNKEYGIYMGDLDGSGPTVCTVRERVCRFEAEWRELIKPFMED
jgi:hypothetical protein